MFFLPYPTVAFQFPTKRRDELVHRIMNDIFREKVACLRSGRRLTRLRQSTVPLCGQTQLCGGPLDAHGGMRDTAAGDLAIFCVGQYSVCELRRERKKGN